MDNAMYKNIFVTGASGCVGWNICRELNRRGVVPFVSVRPTTDMSRLDGIEVHVVRVDLEDDIDLVGVFKSHNIEAVVHAAANVSSDPQNTYESYWDNVATTQTIVDACTETGVKELIYTSTGATLSVVNDEDIEKIKNPYIKHKKTAESLVMNAMGDMKVNITHPIIVIGEHDFNNYVYFFDAVAKGGFFPIPHGRIEFCSAEDIAKAHVKILETDVNGMRFVLGGEYLSWLEFVQIVARVSGKPLPKKATSKLVLYAIACIEQVKGWITSKEPRVTFELLRLLSQGKRVPDYYRRLSSHYLDYRPSPIVEAVEKCSGWRKLSRVQPGLHAVAVSG